MINTYFIFFLLFARIFIIIFYTNFNNKNIQANRILERDEWPIYTEINGVLEFVGSTNDLNDTKKQDLNNIFSLSSLIENNDVFFETQDHLYNYAGNYLDLKKDNSHNRNINDHYYIMTSHQKRDTKSNHDITYYVLYPY